MAGPCWYEGPDFRKRHDIFPSGKNDPHGYSPVTQPLFVHDFTGNGWPDVFIVRRPPGPKNDYGFLGWGDSPGWEGVWYENPAGKNIPWKEHRVLGNIANEAPVWGDINRDGRPELVYSSREQYGYASYDAKDPRKPWTFHPVSEPAGLYLASGVGFGDITGNGKNDVVCPNGWWEQAEHGKPWVWRPHKFAENAAQMLVFDVDGDGLNDVITIWHCHRYGLVWHKQTRGAGGKIRWEMREIFPIEPETNPTALRVSQLHSLALANLGSGATGLVTGKRFWAHGEKGDVEPDAPAIALWFELKRGAGGAEFVPHVMDNDSGAGTQITAVDLTGNGRMDVLTSNKKGVFIYKTA